MQRELGKAMGTTDTAATYKARYDNDSAGMLRWLRERLNIEYGSTTVSTKQVAIRMALGDGLQVDLVPTFPRKGGGYLMPNGSGGWRSTNPPFHAAAMSRANVDLDLDLKPLVRVMKAWNDANSHHLQSFHLEMMVWEMWRKETALPALPQAVADTLRKGVTWMKDPLNDPWPDAPNRAIDTYLSSDERGVVCRLFEADHERAQEALSYDRASKTKEAFFLSAGARYLSAASRATAEGVSPRCCRGSRCRSLPGSEISSQTAPRPPPCG